MLTITRFNNPVNDFKDLIKLLDKELNQRYGALQTQYDQYNFVDNIKNFVIAYNDGIPIGCGAFKEFAEKTIEVKRFYLKPEFRGSGAAGQILNEIEKWALEAGYTSAVLETGMGQPEAIKFYSKYGYEKIENFGQYIGDDNSLCMEKKLSV